MEAASVFSSRPGRGVFHEHGAPPTYGDKVANKPYVTFGSKGGGGAQALDSVERICDGMKMKKAAEGVLATRKPTQEALTECRELGKKLARPEKMVTPKGIEEPRL